MAVDPFLFTGWQRRSAHFVNGGKAPASYSLELDVAGNGQWKSLRTVTVPPGDSAWLEFPDDTRAEWVRVKSDTACAAATVHFTFSNPDPRRTQPDALFTGLAALADTGAHFAGLVRARGDNKRTLHLAAMTVTGTNTTDAGYYELDANLQLRAVNDPAAHTYVKNKVAIPRDVITLDTASVLVVDDRGRRWRLPKTDAAFDDPTRAGLLRICREVATERDVFSAHGTFYELPAENADGFAKIRPVATHRLRLMDYCSYRGLLILTGLRPDAPANQHILRSDDGKAAVWAGAIDDLWKLGKPAGTGGPWHNTAVTAGQPSDPYLLWGYDQRHLTLTASAPARIRIEVDLTGEGLWITHQSFDLVPEKPVEHGFPAAFHARWVRFVADRDCTATTTLRYQ